MYQVTQLVAVIIFCVVALYIWLDVKRTFRQPPPPALLPVLLQAAQAEAEMDRARSEERQVEPMPPALVERIFGEPQGWARDDVSMRAHELYNETRDWNMVAEILARETQGAEMFAQRTLLSDDPYGAPVT